MRLSAEFAQGSGRGNSVACSLESRPTLSHIAGRDEAMADQIVSYLMTTAKGWPFLILCGWIGLSFAAALAWATACWSHEVNDEEDNADYLAYLAAANGQKQRDLASFERRASKGFHAGYMKDHVVDIKTRSKRVH